MVGRCTVQVQKHLQFCMPRNSKKICNVESTWQDTLLAWKDGACTAVGFDAWAVHCSSVKSFACQEGSCTVHLLGYTANTVMAEAKITAVQYHSIAKWQKNL